MKTDAKVTIAFTSVLLVACQGNQSSTTEPLPSQANDLINGYYLSKLVVSDASGMVQLNLETSINLDKQHLYTRDIVGMQTALPPMHEILYPYNDMGQFTMHDVFTDNEGDSTKTFEYDSNGRLIGSSGVDKKGLDRNESFSYNEQGQVIARFENGLENGNAFEAKFQYNSAGKLERLTQKNPTLPILGDVTSFIYNSDNRLTESQLDLESDGTVDKSFSYSYNDKGHLSQRIEYDSAGAMVEQIDYSYTATNELVFNQMLFEMKYYPQ